MRTILKHLTLPGLTACLFLLLNLFSGAQTSTVVIAEVMYDHPLYDNEGTRTAHMGEFMSLYNYGEDEVNIDGWRIEITDLTVSPNKQYTYTFPTNTKLSDLATVVVASRPDNSVFNVLQYYGLENPESYTGHIVHYTSSLAFPDTRSRIRVYDAQNRIQDELTYNGNSSTLANESLLRAENAVNPNRPLKETASIQRESIKLNGNTHVISRADYYTSAYRNPVQLYNFLPDGFTYASSASVPDDPPVSISGTITKDQYKEAPGIESNQVIAGGTTTYMAGDEIILSPGFAVRDGAEFHAVMDRDKFHHVGMLTYNLAGIQTFYTKHAEYIKDSKADIVALQEVMLRTKFINLKKACGLNGNMFVTLKWAEFQYGIGLLWNPDVVGMPIEKSYKRLSTPHDGSDDKRGYMVAEFKDFCFVATHLSKNETHRIEMVNNILSNPLVHKCNASRKPVYIAGDMNAQPHENPIVMLQNNGYTVLNDTAKSHSTRPESGAHIDLILEHNTNQYHKKIDCGIPIPENQRDKWYNEDKISDHFPYFVKVKVK
ncbi:MAG: lamin tail domain-containing protein [Bacteroides sp.]|nr:lamin tail domain-containing protein [Ruminococcus flavefaciens]MCM1554919.1 lamin tail domain-containing protein [Bacteroides sp.]